MMAFKQILTLAAAMAMLVLVGAAGAQAQLSTPAQAAVAAAGKGGHYAFILFYKEDDDATRAMRQTLDAALARRAGQATVVTVRTTDPAEKALVTRYGVSRSPMPLALAVAPNGAITGGFPLKLTGQEVAGAFVSPGTAACLKATQARKLVLLCVQPAGTTSLPAGVSAIQADPEYGPVTEVVTIRADDATEAGFLKLLELQPKPGVSLTTVLVPPGQRLAVFEGAFTRQAFAEQVKAASQACCPGGKCGPNGCGPN